MLNVIKYFLACRQSPTGLSRVVNAEKLCFYSSVIMLQSRNFLVRGGPGKTKKKTFASIQERIHSDFFTGNTLFHSDFSSLIGYRSMRSSSHDALSPPLHKRTSDPSHSVFKMVANLAEL